MTDGLDVVTVGIDHERTIVVWMIVRAQARRAIVLGARCERRAIKGIDGFAFLGRKGDMQPSLERFAA